MQLITGQYLSASDIDFYIDTDAEGREMVIVSDTVHQKQHTDFLARHISEYRAHTSPFFFRCILQL